LKVSHGIRRMVGIAAVALLITGVGVAVAATSSPSSNAHDPGMGINEYGMTHAYYNGIPVSFTYSRGFFCDTTVSSSASSRCEAGANWQTPPSTQHDPLYITVPLGFTVPMAMDCPSGLICVDHPGTIDLSRLEPSLKPLYPNLTDAQLTAVLRNFAVPGHDHFITDLNHGGREWWDVKVIGVTSPDVYNNILAHKSFGYIDQLLKAHDPHVVGPIPTNLFLYFAAA
jgi:hypothetical protein